MRLTVAALRGCACRVCMLPRREGTRAVLREDLRASSRQRKEHTLVDTLTFVGTATTVLRLGSFTLLTDPNFLHQGQRAYLGKGLWTRRLTEPCSWAMG